MSEQAADGTDLWTRPALNRPQLVYLCALLETRAAAQVLSHGETAAERSERAAGAMARVRALEGTLSASYHATEGMSGVDHLLDYLGEIVGEHDAHGLWQREGEAWR